MGQEVLTLPNVGQQISLFGRVKRFDNLFHKQINQLNPFSLTQVKVGLKDYNPGFFCQTTLCEYGLSNPIPRVKLC